MTFVLGDSEPKWGTQTRMRMSQETEAARPERLRKEEEKILAKVLTTLTYPPSLQEK